MFINLIKNVNNLIYKKEKLRCKILFVDDDTHNLLHNKIKFNEYMMKHYIDYIPKIFCLNNKMIDKNICYPVIIKPNVSVCGKNMQK